MSQITFFALYAHIPCVAIKIQSNAWIQEFGLQKRTPQRSSVAVLVFVLKLRTKQAFLLVLHMRQVLWVDSSLCLQIQRISPHALHCHDGVLFRRICSLFLNLS